MSKKLYEENNIRDIASAIREQNGTQDSYTVAQMGNAVRAIKTQPDLETLTVTENGNYLPSSGKDGFSSVSVNVESGEAVVQPLSVTKNGTYNPPSGVDGYAPVTVNVSGEGGVFQGDGREYLFDWKFGSNSGRIYVSKTGDMEWYSGFQEIDGEFLYEAANSEAVTAKANCYLRISTDSVYNAEMQEAAGDTISSAIPQYARLVIAYESSGQTSPYEMGAGWSTGDGALIRFIIKADGTLIPHSADPINGNYIYSTSPSLSDHSYSPFYLKNDFIGSAVGTNGDLKGIIMTCTKKKTSSDNILFLPLTRGAICFVK